MNIRFYLRIFHSLLDSCEILAYSEEEVGGFSQPTKNKQEENHEKDIVLLLALCMAAVFFAVPVFAEGDGQCPAGGCACQHTGSFGTGPCRSCTSRRHGNTGS